MRKEDEGGAEGTERGRNEDEEGVKLIRTNGVTGKRRKGVTRTKGQLARGENTDGAAVEGGSGQQQEQRLAPNEPASY